MKRVYFVATEVIRWPESGQVLVHIGELLTVTQLSILGSEFGIDNIQGRAIIADNMTQAMDIKLGL